MRLCTEFLLILVLNQSLTLPYSQTDSVQSEVVLAHVRPRTITGPAIILGFGRAEIALWSLRYDYFSDQEPPTSSRIA